MRAAALASAGALALAAPVAAQAIDGPMTRGGEATEPATVAPRCAGLMLVIASQEPRPATQGPFLVLVAQAAAAREAEGRDAGEAAVREEIVGYADAYVRAVRGGALTREGFDTDRAFCFAVAGAMRGMLE